MATDTEGGMVTLELWQQYGRKTDGHPGTERHDQRSGRCEHLRRIDNLIPWYTRFFYSETIFDLGRSG